MKTNMAACMADIQPLFLIGLNLSLTSFDLSGLSPSCCLLFWWFYCSTELICFCQPVCAIHPCITSTHLFLGNLSVLFIRRCFFWGQKPSGADEEAQRSSKCVELHPIYCQTSSRSLMQMYKLPRLWMYLKFDHISYPRTQTLPPELHTPSKNMQRPEFSPNEVLIRDSLFFHNFYFLY